MFKKFFVFLFLAIGLIGSAFAGIPARAQTLVAPYAGAPECSHDPTVWHGLWDFERGCHYDHQHGDDPHSVDGLFGTAFLEDTGGELQMFYQPAPVNDIDYRRKHFGLFWMVRQGETCYSQFGDGCVTDFRAQVHMIPDPMDNYRLNPDGTVQSASYHVYRVEARVCDEANPTVCGIIRIGGRQYLGDIMVDEQVIIDNPEPVDLFGTRTSRPFSLNYWGPAPGNKNVTTWYPVSPGALARISVEIRDVYAAINPQDLTDTTLLGGDASQLAPHIVGFGVPPKLRSTFDPDGDGIFNLSGWLNVDGFINRACTATGPGCIPFEFTNVPDRQYQYRGTEREYDIKLGGQSSGWIEYPGLALPFVLNGQSQPTSTPVPPTATAVPPTATSVPPTVTPVPPTSTPYPSPTASPTATAYPSPTQEPTVTPASGFVVDHTNLELFYSIPRQVVAQASQMTMAFADRSVGSNISDGLTCLSYSSVPAAPNHCKRPNVETAEFTPDAAYYRELWDFVDAGTWNLYPGLDLSGYQVIGYMPNYLELPDDRLSSKFDSYIDVATAHADGQQVILYTSSLSRLTGTEYSTAFNNDVRAWAAQNGAVLVDIADILSHRPDGSECLLNGNPIICETYTSEVNGGHLGTPSAGKIRVAKAIWIAMAHIAGWTP